MQIEVSGLHKSFLDGEGHQLHILKGLNFKLEAGASASIVGASGTGKSTFLHILGTLDEGDSGRICFENTDLMQMKREESSAFRNKTIGFIFQFHQLLQDFNALENVMIPALILGNSRTTAMERSKMLLDQVGLFDRMHHKPSQLSGGEQQRVSIARALVHEPAYLLADEPTGEVDTDTGYGILQMLRDIADGGTTVVMATHDPKAIEDVDIAYLVQSGTLHLPDRDELNLWLTEGTEFDV